MSDTNAPAEHADLLAAVVTATTAAGDRLLADFSPDARPASRADMAARGHQIENLVLAELRPELAGLRPGAGWVDEDLETTPLPPGGWGAGDAGGGAGHSAHACPVWAVTVTLLRAAGPTLTVVRQPIGDLTYTALVGGGAYLNGRRLRASAKTDLEAAVVVTGQAEAGQDGTYRRIGAYVPALLDRALLV